MDLAAVCDLILQVKQAQLELYRAAAVALPEQKRIWLMFETDCESHQLAYTKVRTAATENPGRWVQHPFTEQVAKHLLDEMRASTPQLRDGKLVARYAYTFMADAEKSLLDAKLYDAVRTDLTEYANLLDTVKNEALAHSTKLRELSRM